MALKPFYLLLALGLLTIFFKTASSTEEKDVYVPEELMNKFETEENPLEDYAEDPEENEYETEDSLVESDVEAPEENESKTEWELVENDFEAPEENEYETEDSLVESDLEAPEENESETEWELVENDFEAPEENEYETEDSLVESDVEAPEENEYETEDSLVENDAEAPEENEYETGEQVPRSPGRRRRRLRRRRYGYRRGYGSPRRVRYNRRLRYRRPRTRVSRRPRIRVSRRPRIRVSRRPRIRIRRPGFRNPCFPSPCLNGGTCFKIGWWFKKWTFRCKCSGLYFGRRCEKRSTSNPCNSSPCKNGGICSNNGATFKCQCKNNYIGRTCETKPPNPCSPNPCRNQGVCRVIGNGFSCKCPPLFGGSKCQHERTSCTAAGDPHYTTFDNKKINFQGKCEYIFAEDCSPSKSFRVWTKNVACGRPGRGASCVSYVRIILGRNEIKLTRSLRTAIVNGAKVTQFPFKGRGFVIINPTRRWLHVLAASVGIRVSWDCRNRVTVSVLGQYKGKTCGLCGNNNGNAADDTINVADYPCVPPDKTCVASADAAPIIEKCNLMKNAPFSTCNNAVDPTNFIEDCKFDACRCEDPKQCVCNSFAAYSQSCSENSVVLDWRFSGTHLVPALSHCAQQCSIPGQVFTECGSSCVQSCRDLLRATECKEQCVPGCQCPQGLVLNDEKCIPIAKCPCEFEGKPLQPGESVAVGNCKTCTCDMGAVKCVEDRECASKGPCDSFPCRNDGICSVQGDTFSCQCTSDYQGNTCEELKPKPCDSQPCLNGGVCTNAGSSFSCECPKGFKGDTCADVECVDKKLDILYVVDGSGSIRQENFDSIKLELKEMNGKFAIGPDKIQIALMQFGRATDTRIEFNLGEKTSLQVVNEGVDNMQWLSSLKTATRDALKKAGELVFNGNGGDRSTADNVLILFTDGVATDSISNDSEDQLDQFQVAQKLKDAGVKIITVAMGSQTFIESYRGTLQKLASIDDETGQPLQFEAGFDNLNELTSKLVKGAC